MGSKMFYAHAQKVVFFEHAKDVLLLYVHAYWMGGTESCSAPLSLELIMTMVMLKEHPLVGMFSPSHPIDMCI